MGTQRTLVHFGTGRGRKFLSFFLLGRKDNQTEQYFLLLLLFSFDLLYIYCQNKNRNAREKTNQPRGMVAEGTVCPVGFSWSSTQRISWVLECQGARVHGHWGTLHVHGHWMGPDRAFCCHLSLCLEIFGYFSSSFSSWPLFFPKRFFIKSAFRRTQGSSFGILKGSLSLKGRLRNSFNSFGDPDLQVFYPRTSSRKSKRISPNTRLFSTGRTKKGKIQVWLFP